MNENLLWKGRISSIYDTMTAMEKTISDYILTHAEEVAQMSLHELAEAANVSPSTVSRYCRKIGFSNFQTFKISMTNEWLTPDFGLTELTEDESVSTLKQKVLLFNKRLLEDMVLTLEDEKLEQAAKLISRSQHVLFLSEGASGASAKAACLAFQQLGVNCEYMADPYIELVRVGQLGADDVVIGITYSGRSKNTTDCVKIAHERGVPTIGIVGIPNTPMSRNLTIELQINAVASESFCDSLAARISECAVCSILYCLLMMTDCDHTMRKHVENLYELLRV